MAIYRLLRNTPFEPETVRTMTEAYEHSLRALQIARDDPITGKIAMEIIAIAQTDVDDPITLSDRALKALGLRDVG